MKLKLLFAWYDIWIGFFYDKNKNWLYILPIPMFGLIIKLPQKRYYCYLKGTKQLKMRSSKDAKKIHCNEYDLESYWSVNGELEELFGNTKPFS